MPHRGFGTDAPLATSLAAFGGDRVTLTVAENEPIIGQGGSAGREARMSRRVLIRCPTTREAVPVGLTSATGQWDDAPCAGAGKAMLHGVACGQDHVWKKEQTWLAGDLPARTSPTTVAPPVPGQNHAHRRAQRTNR